jgi:two-component system, LytTR family, response regulator
VIRALVVDDELPAREELALLLAETGEIEVVAKAANAVEALAAIRRDRPAVVFLDVQMPGVSGLELLGMVDDELLPEIIFVTAHERFAVRAFEENAVDYLLKPVAPDRLAATVARLRSRTGLGPRPAFPSPPISRVPCCVKRAIKLVPVADIELVKSTPTGVSVVCSHGEYATDLTLQVLEARGGFLRCHKQYLVNAAAVDLVALGEDAMVRTRSGFAVPVSRRHLPLLRQRLGL